MKLPPLCGAGPHSPHFVELELVGRVGRFPPVVSWVEAVEDGVWGEQVAGGKRGERSQQQPVLPVPLARPLTGSEPSKGDYELHEVGLKTMNGFSLISLQKETCLLPGCESTGHQLPSSQEAAHSSALTPMEPH